MLQIIPADKPDNTFFVSDTHFGHKNILNYCPNRQRWASTIEEMDEKLIAAWNSVVGKWDVVLHLGDFALVRGEEMERYIKRLNGVIVLVKGNHDRCTNTKYREAGIASIVKSHFFSFAGIPLFCIHSPHHDDLSVKSLFPPGADYPEFLFHGHTHGLSRPDAYRDANGIRGFDVGIDAMCTTLNPGAVPAPITLRKAVEYATNYGKNLVQSQEEETGV